MARRNGAFYSATVATTSEQTAHTVQATNDGRRGCTTYTKASAAGTATWYYVDPEGTASELATQTVAAGVLAVKDFDLHCPEVTVTWTSDSSSSLTVTQETFVY